MPFENDVLISYAHIDDMALMEGQKGWISTLHRALEIRLAQLLGRTPRIWRDPKLSGNDVFADHLIDRLPGVAILLSVVSPRYLKSDWCLRELREFIKAAESAGGVRRGHKLRVFKVVKTPVPLDQQVPELRHMLGYDFFTTDPHTGRPKELSSLGDTDSQRLYWAKLDDLAHDMAELLESLDTGTAPPPAELPMDRDVPVSSVMAPILPGSPREDEAVPAPVWTPGEDEPVVYLAETTYDLRERRDAIRRELQSQGLRVLPEQQLPYVIDECDAAIRRDLAQCTLSVHLVGRNYGLVPDGATQSVVCLQHELAIARAAEVESFPRFVWIPAGLDVEDERQQRFLDQIRTDDRIQAGADILETPFEEFRVTLNRRLREIREQAEARRAAQQETTIGGDTVDAPDDGLRRIYLISDRRDESSPSPIADYLFDQGFEVILPVFDGDEAEIRRDHEENLSICDAVLFYYGEGNELWLRQKLREVQKSAAFGRQRPILLKAIYVAPPDSPSKQRFRTREALVIDQRSEFDPAALSPFISQLH